jgi:hypothetical protein
VIVLNKNLRLKMIASKDKRKKRKSSDYQNSCNNIIEDLFLRMNNNMQHAVYVNLIQQKMNIERWFMKYRENQGKKL